MSPHRQRRILTPTAPERTLAGEAPPTLKVTYLGVGEAFDETQPNTCLLVESPNTKLLLDCGFSAVPAVWATLPDPEVLDGVYLSHTHADHLFGLPGLLVRFAEEGRQKPLTLLGRPGLADHLKRVLDFAYPGIASRLTFQLRFVTLDPASPEPEAPLGDLRLRAAPTAHSVPSLGLRVSLAALATAPAPAATAQAATADPPAGGPTPAAAAAAEPAAATAASNPTDTPTSGPAPGPAAVTAGPSLCYSGDGMWTAQAAALYAGCDLLVHECYLEEGETKGHCSIEAALDLYRQARPRQMALVHLRRSLRPKRETLLARFEEEGLAIGIPEAGEVVNLGLATEDAEGG